MPLLINHFYRFADFTIDTAQRVLLREGKPLALTPKVFDTLLIMVENSGRIVEKEELMSRLWPDTFVEESNLTFNIKQLRKSLGDDAREPRYIETIARRGYRFIAKVEEVLSESAEMSGRTAQRIESSDAQSPDAAGKTGSHAEARQAEPAPALANSYTELFEKNLHPAHVSGVTSTGIRKRTLALAAALAVLATGGGLVFWHFSNGSNNSSVENSRHEGKTTVVLPLKQEMLSGVGEGHVAISPDGKYIAFTRSEQQKSSIWIRQLATNANVEVVPSSGSVYGLAFTNSGESLYFVRRDAVSALYPGSGTALYRVPLLGGVPTKIVDRLEGNFSVSADDSQIAFIRQVLNRDGQREYSLMIANSDGTDQRTLLIGTHPAGLDVPIWAPDRKSILCAYGNSDGGGQDVSIVECSVGDGLKKELFSEKFFHIAKMAWLPDKSGLILSAKKRLEASRQLWRGSYPKMEFRQITEEPASYVDLSIASASDKAVASQVTRISDIWVGSGRDSRTFKKISQARDSFCWTADGRIVYVSIAGGNSGLWVMQPDGSEQRQLTVDSAANDQPFASSDNRYIAFVSNRTGANQVWRMNTDGGNPMQLTNGVAKNYPAISPDGRWVLYNTVGDWHLWRITIDGGEPAPLTDYIASRPSVSPDGKMIACIGRTESKRELLVLPFEGGRTLKRFDYDGWSSRLQWTGDGKALIYAIERDGVRSLMKQSLAGGPPEEIASFGEDDVFDFGYSFDGQTLAVIRGGWQHDVVLISGLASR